jgi:uncharacterized protein (TIGR03435 family)
MRRRLYRWVVRLHPPQFRQRFGDEFLCIFDEAGPGAAGGLLLDGVISLARQWAVRSKFGLVLIALAGAVVQMTLGIVWFGSMGRRVARNLAPRGTGTPHEMGLLLLAMAGLITAILLGATAMAVTCMHFCNRRVRNSRMRRLALVPLVAAGLWAPSPTHAQTFEVASIRLNTSGCAGGRGGGGPTPGRLSVKCIAIKDLIQAAYGTFAHGPPPDPRLPQVLGAPGWVESDTYDIAAKPAGNAGIDEVTIDKIYGPMLRTLLEDRFKLKIHRETRELPVYALTVAKGGPKLVASKEGSCTVFDPGHPPPQPSRGQAPPVLCGRTSFQRHGGIRTVDAFGVSMDRFAGITLSTRLDLDRPVLDKTGLTGLFDVHLEFDAGNDTGPSLFTAMQEQLGLRLAPDTGPVDVLVVDHIERPSGN